MAFNKRSPEADALEQQIHDEIFSTVKFYFQSEKTINQSFCLRVWTSLRNNPALRDMYACAFNIFQDSFSEYIYIRLKTIVLNEYKVIICAPFAWLNPHHFEEILTDAHPSMGLACHSHILYDFREFLNRRNDVVTIAVNPENARWKISLTGNVIQSKLKIIPRDAKCLVRLLNASRSNKLICCNPDLAVSEIDQFSYVNPILFEFCNRIGLKIWFSKHSVTEDFTIQGEIMKVGICSDTREAVKKFIDFNFEKKLKLYEKESFVLGST